MSNFSLQTLSPRRRRLGRRSPSVLAGARSRHRPRFDVMEDRTLLSALLVNTTADSGPGSLRQAILDSNSAAGSSNTITSTSRAKAFRRSRRSRRCRRSRMPC